MFPIKGQPRQAPFSQKNVRSCPLQSIPVHPSHIQNHEPADMLKTHAIMALVKMRCIQSDMASRPKRISRTSSLPAGRLSTLDLSVMARGRPHSQRGSPNPGRRRSSAFMRRTRHSCRLESIRGFKNPFAPSRLCAFALNPDFVIGHPSLCPSAALYKTGLFGTGTDTRNHLFLTNSQTILGPVPFYTAHAQSTNPGVSKRSTAVGLLSPLPQGEGQGEGFPPSKFSVLHLK